MRVPSSTQLKKGCPALRTTHRPPRPARVLFGAGAVTVSGVVLAKCGKLASFYPPTRLFGNFFVEILEEVPVAVAVRRQRDR